MARTKRTTVTPYSSPTETEKNLQELQELFLANRGNQEISDKFFLLLRTYTRSLVLKEVKRKSLFLLPERIDELSTDATLLLLDQYRVEGWKIQASFAGALKYKIWDAMYKRKNDEMNFSLNTTFTDDSDSKEIMDLVGSNTVLPWQMVSGTITSDDPFDSIASTMNIAYSEIEEVIKEAHNALPYKSFMRFLPWLILQIRRPKTRNISQLFRDLYITSREEDAFNILLLEIRNRIMSHA